MVAVTASVEEGFLVLRESNAVLRKTVKTAAGDSGFGVSFLFMNGVCRSKVGLVNPGALVYNIMYCQNGCGMQRRRT